MSKINNRNNTRISQNNIISRKMQLIISTFLLSMLTSCSVYKNSFDCKPGKGIGCESVSRVNDLLDDDELDAYIDRKYGKKNNEVVGEEKNHRKEQMTHAKNTKCDACQNRSEAAYNQRKFSTTQIQDKSRGEEIKVWFRGYTDEKGIKHDAHNVYIKAKGTSDAK